MNKTRKKLLISIALLLCTAFIFHNSLQPGEVSSGQSGHLLLLLQDILGKIKLNFLTEYLIRKIAHFSEFALEGLLLYLFFCEVVCLRRYAVCIAAFAGLLAAMTDETIQLFVEGRSGQVTDVWIDFAGVVTGVVVMMIFMRIFFKVHCRKRLLPEEKKGMVAEDAKKSGVDHPML